MALMLFSSLKTRKKGQKRETLASKTKRGSKRLTSVIITFIFLCLRQTFKALIKSKMTRRLKILLFPVGSAAYSASSHMGVKHRLYFSAGLLTAEVPHTSLCPFASVFPKWAQRVGFKSKDPLQNSSLIIMTTDISDEGIYICRIVSFPDGNFDTEVSLKVWSESIFLCFMVELCRKTGGNKVFLSDCRGEAFLNVLEEIREKKYSRKLFY